MNDVTFQDVLDSGLPFDMTHIDGDNPNNWMWKKSVLNMDTFYPTVKK
jgi:hypothetical protein